MLDEQREWRLTSWRCGMCGCQMNAGLGQMSNEDAERAFGHSGGRHYCDDCRPRWVEWGVRQVAVVLDCVVALEEFVRERKGRCALDIAEEFSRLMRSGSVDPALVHEVARKIGVRLA